MRFPRRARRVRRRTSTARAPRRRASPPRAPSYFVVDGFDLRAEMLRFCELPALGGPDGRMRTEPPELTVRRASSKPRRTLGFAVPAQHRLSVTAYPGIRRSDLEETLCHELVHLTVGAAPQSRRWHGTTFTATLAAAMEQGYGIRLATPGAAAHHGAYAEAIERRRRAEREGA